MATQVAQDNGHHANGFHKADMPHTNGFHTNGTINTQINGTGTNGTEDCENQSNGSITPPPPIAIVGMALRLPGGVSSTESFWELLVNGRDARCRVPNSRYNIEAFHGPRARKGEVAAQYGYFLEDSLEHLDASFFAMSKSEISQLDPQQKLLLEVVYECMENAGQSSWRGSKMGCYVGVFGEDWLDLCNKDTQAFDMYRISGTGDFAISNRISYEYDLKGPSMTIRTGCSSALVGLDEACQALANGHCTSAIVAGTNIIVSPTMTQHMTQQGVLSPEGSCKTFDAAADGYARGEAINAVFIKRLDDAIRDGDPIRAVIRSTFQNCDGKTAGLTNPSSQAHEDMMRTAYGIAQLPVSRTAYVECHGTGTAVGDPLETIAIGKVFEGSGVYIGSVKPNVGHAEGASGVTSLIKAVLALENRTIPPNIKFSKPNPKIPFKEANLKVPLEPIPWPTDRAERVSVNSFGIGGANAHVILDSTASFLGPNARTQTQASTPKTPATPRLLTISANTSESLRRRVTGFQTYIESSSDAIDDVAHTLALRREHLPHRAFGVAISPDSLKISNFFKAPRKTPSINWIFTGQGAQWANMGVELVDSFPHFREDIMYLDKVLHDLPDGPEWSLIDELATAKETSRINDAEFSQPLCTALQICLVNLLTSWGIHPNAVVGHSSGEIAAAYAAKAITAEAAIIVAYYRGQITKTKTRAGAMAAVGLGREEISASLIDGVVIACENSPKSVTLSGDADKLDAVLEQMKKERPDVFCRLLKVEMAYHSHHMSELGERYESLMRPHIQSNAPNAKFYSSVYGKAISTAGQLDAPYWRANMENPVLFYTAISSLLSTSSDSPHLFLEIGPHSALAGPLRQIFQHKQLNPMPAYISTLTRNENQTHSILSTAGQLFQHGIHLDFATINGPGKVLTDLPAYPWQRDTSYWKESRVTRNWRLREFPHHELLGSRILESSDLEPSWRNVLHLDSVPWLRDHKIVDDIVFPAAGYIGAVGEAVRQLIGSADYSIKRLVVKSAFVLQEGQAPELVTNLKRLKLTESLESDWLEFSMESYDGSKWTRHCTGQVKGGGSTDLLDPSKTVDVHPRKVASNVWYPAMKSIGLNYGPRFQGLKNITAHPVKPVASANVQDDTELHESAYSIHPTVIDQTLQLFTVAMSNGLARKLDKLAIPAVIGELYIGGGGSLIAMEAKANVTPKGAIQGSAIATSNGKVVLSLTNSTFNPLETDSASSREVDNLAAVRLDWQPDIDFLDPTSLIHAHGSKTEAIRLIESLAVLCMIYTSSRLTSLSIASPHLQKFRSWLVTEVSRMSSGSYHWLPSAQEWSTLPPSSIQPLLDQAFTDASANTDSAPIASVLLTVLDNCESICLDRVTGIEILLPNSGLASIYTFYQDMTSLTPFFNALGHSQPTLRVLEIGAGTGGTTAHILSALQSDTGTRMFGTYMYTDISAGFFPAAKEKFKEYAGLEYKVLDISKDVVEQGFEAGTYDIVVASNVLHATPNLRETLGNVRTLLAKGGRLFLQELGPETRWTNYIMGILPGWWLGADDGRPDEPFISTKRWNDELKAAGFGGVDGVVWDNEAPWKINANMIATAVTADLQPEKEISLLYDGEVSDAAREIEQHFIREGYHVNWTTLSCPPEGKDTTIIVLLDLAAPFLADLDTQKWTNLQTFFDHASKLSTHIIWVSHAAQTDCSNPSYGLLPGFARTIRSELALDLATFEVDVLGVDAWMALSNLTKDFTRRRRKEDLDPDYEFAFMNGKIHTSRFHWVSSNDDKEVEGAVTNNARLEIGNYGLLGSLTWSSFDKPSVLEGDQVEVQIRSVGLNFRDVLVTLGIVDGPKHKLGLEGAGIVTRTAPGVENLRVGDRVFTCDRGCLATTMVTSAKLCARIPDSLSFEDAATMPCVYSTVIHSLINLGGLERGMSVLIHSACGGVGIAAIQICRMMGAEIYCTVGTQDKAQYLIDTYRIPRTRIFDSRSTSFLPALMRTTNNKGVDLVLNSLSGELLHASWKCVAPFGMMLEIGKRDFIGHAQLAMDIFEENRSFMGIDLAQLIEQKPQTCQKLLEQCLTYYRQGAIEAVKPVKVFEAKDVVDAFRYMQKGQHIGKIVINLPEAVQELQVQPKSKVAGFRADASYLLVGGLGGLGRAVSTWMVERGARSLVYLSRSAGTTDEDRSFFRELEVQGCEATAVAGSVTCLEDVQRAMAQAPKPIAGIMQLSMVLRDQSFLQMSHEDWSTPLASKVQGTWTLHQAFQNVPLDFFLLFSSLSGIVGQWGQANYAAANTCLDSFVQYRHGLGLPASVIDVGVMEDVGYVSQNAAVLDMFRAYSMHGLKEVDLLRSIELAIGRSMPLAQEAGKYSSSGQVTTGLASSKSILDLSNRAVWKRDVRMAMYRNRESAKQSGPSTASEGLKDVLAAVASTPAMLDEKEHTDLLTQEIGKRIRSFMIQSDDAVDVKMTLSDMGVDSLVSIEIRNWWRMGLGLDISVLEIMSAGSIERLGAVAADGLRAKFGPKDGPHPGLAMKAP
ncbi:hypothetical protein DE146DRAFT_653958 [Phaeosphaeria sp. MPI-PUGE-AT-0046c]|nr:hypothetical protein DE146DRAFT_653958 [Phaeosphaeria sp. MPI-PUGE-AT-0046c]